MVERRRRRRRSLLSARPGQRLVGGVDRRGGHDELGIAAAQAQLDLTRSELAGDLLGRRPQGLEQGEVKGGIEGGEQALGQHPALLASRLGGGRDLLMDVLDVGA